MVTKELINYIQQQVTLGETPDKIKSVLLSQGWKLEDINEGFLQNERGQALTPVISKDQNQMDTASKTADIKKSNWFNWLINPAAIFDFKNLKWYEWIVLLPAFVLFIEGGLIGAVVGVLGWMLSLKVIRDQKYSKTFKAVAVFGIIVAYYIISFVAAFLLLQIIKVIMKK